MRKIIVIILFLIFASLTYASSWIRVNQIGYLENDIKVAVWISKGVYRKEYQNIG